jgi:formylmethanofuran dehydrogenase subunit E
MDTNDELYKAGLMLHGHKCPAMPMGLRAGLAALEALGVPRAADGQLTALVEIDRDHCATCYADGVQMATGCTFGKGNIQKLGYGKFALTLVDNKTRRSVRVVTRPETIQRSKESEFIGYRKQGVPASKIEPSLVEPLVEAMLSAPTDTLFIVEPVKEFNLPPARPHDFDTITCAECGEVVVERYARVKAGKIVCIPCAEKV